MKRTTRDLAWWYWLTTVGLLASGLLGWTNGIPLAIFLCAVQVIHFGWRTCSITALPVQVRVTYLLLLALGLWTPLQWIHLVQVIGTSARVLVGYCLLARTLSLAPWNRVEPLSRRSCTKHILFNAVRDRSLWVRPAAAVARRVRTRYEMGRPLSIGRPDFSSEHHSPEPSQPTRRMRHVTDSHQ